LITMVELSKLSDVGQRMNSSCASILRKYWCPFVLSKGRCDRMCADNPLCAQNVRFFMNDIEKAETPAALLIWRIRNGKAKINEQISAAEKEPVKVNQLGEVVTGDVFARIEASIQ